jgi:hypothetical protein
MRWSSSASVMRNGPLAPVGRITIAGVALVVRSGVSTAASWTPVTKVRARSAASLSTARHTRSGSRRTNR